MKCESTALGKYLETSKNIFFIYGSEVVLRNNAKDSKGHLNKKGFLKKEQLLKKILTKLKILLLKVLVDRSLVKLLLLYIMTKENYLKILPKYLKYQTVIVMSISL